MNTIHVAHTNLEEKFETFKNHLSTKYPGEPFQLTYEPHPHAGQIFHLKTHAPNGAQIQIHSRHEQEIEQEWRSTLWPEEWPEAPIETKTKILYKKLNALLNPYSLTIKWCFGPDSNRYWEGAYGYWQAEVETMSRIRHTHQGWTTTELAAKLAKGLQPEKPKPQPTPQIPKKPNQEDNNFNKNYNHWKPTSNPPVTTGA
jgi:hypothetical protein